MAQLIVSIDYYMIPLTTIILFFFFSLIFLALAIAWNAIPATRNLELSVSSMRSLWTLTLKMIGKLAAFIVPFIISYGVLYFSSGFLDAHMNIGPIREVDQVSPSSFYGISLFLISIRISLYLVNVGYITEYALIDTFTESLAATILFHIVFPLFIIPVVILSYSIVYIGNIGAPINPPNYLFIVPYLWTLFMVFILFGTDFWAEKEGEERLAE